MRRVILAALACVLAAPSGWAQGTVSGIVKEDSTGRAVAGAVVSIEKAKRQATTDETGRYLLADLPVGTQVMQVRRIGYVAASAIALVAQGETRTKDITLTRSPQALDTVKVSDTRKQLGVGLAGFDDRKRLGFGHFIDSTFLQQNEHRKLADVLRMVQGIELKQPPFCGQPYSVGIQRLIRRINCISNRNYLVAMGGADCAIQIMVDGAVYVPGKRIDTDEPPRDPSNDWTTTYDISSFQVSELVAMEVYRRSAVPMEYRGYDTECGLILMWTKRGRR